MISKVVSTIWAGQVAVHEKYIKQAKKKRTDLEIIVGRERMFIKRLDIDLLVRSKSELIQDKFSDEKYRLWYFLWNPETKEEETRRLLGY